jgi:Protein of unknown function (DUF4089)
MPDTPPDYEALIQVHANWLGLTIDPAWHPTICQSLAAFSAAMQAVDGFPLPDEAEPAPVFQS